MVYKSVHVHFHTVDEVFLMRQSRTWVMSVVSEVEDEEEKRVSNDQRYVQNWH